MMQKVTELWHFRELLIALTLREIKIRYKQTLLGAAWAVLQPISMMIIFSLVFGLFLKVKTEGIPYPLFYYSGLVPWTFFSTSVSFGSLAVVNNSNLVTKIYFPREVLPFASLGAALLDLIIAGIIFIGFMIFYNVPLTFNLISILPIILTLTIFAAALILIASALNVMWRDVKFVIPLLVQLWMILSPVIYPISQVPERLHGIFILNPLAPIIDNFRRVTIQGAEPQWSELSLALIVSIISFLAAYIFFKKKEKKFADII